MRLSQALLMISKAIAATGWVLRTGLPKAPAVTGVMPMAYGNGRFVAMDNDSVGTASYTSTDGISWTQGVMPSAKNWTSVAFGNGIFVAIASGNPAGFATSTDGVTWNPGTLPVNQAWNSIAFGNGTFVAVANGTTYATCTTPGSTAWTQRTFGNSGNYTTVVFGNGVFSAIRVASGQVSTTSSTNGVAWGGLAAGASVVATMASAVAIAYGNGLWVVINTSGTACSVTNTATNTSTAVVLPASGAWGSVACSTNGLFVALDSASSAYITSTDGITWTRGTVPATASWSRLVYGSGLFVALMPSQTNFITLAAA